MDIFNIQALIAKRKLVTAEDTNPENAYVQIGMYQEGNRRLGSSNADTYSSYAMSLDEVKKLINNSSGPVVDGDGNLIVADSSNDTVIVGPGGTHDIHNFSGMFIVNDHYDGGMEMWLCGGGSTAMLISRTPYGPGVGTVTINGSVNGYTWTNTHNQVGPFTFTVVKTRNGA